MKALLSLLLLVPQPIDQSHNLNVSCDGITFSTDGYPDGATGLFSLNNEPPGLLQLNSTVALTWPNDKIEGAPVGYRQYAFFMVPGDLSQQVIGDISCPVVAVGEPPVPVQKELPSSCVTVCWKELEWPVTLYPW